MIKFRLLAAALICILGLGACKTTEKGRVEKPKRSGLAVMLDTSEVFSANLTGFALYDTERDSMIFGQNEQRYFTPASNTKLFTFYTGLKLLPDSLRALEYVVRGDSLIFWGTGDPSLLHPDLGNRRVYDFLKRSDKKLYFSDSNFKDELLGPGWSWSDYQYYYQTEKTPLPLYGNTVRFEVEEIEMRKIADTDSGLSVSPKYFRAYVKEGGGSGEAFLHRGMTSNSFHYTPEADTTAYTLEKPFHYSPQLITEMLGDTLGKEVEYTDMKQPDALQQLYSIPSDTAYKRMLRQSDNFIAEQLLFVTASELGTPLNSSSVIDTMMAKHLKFISREPQWVDGSGLSRYNMVTPASMVELLTAIDKEFEKDRELFELLPAGGESGTIENWYAARDSGGPYVYAKTGTLSNNHCLSGYLLTESGKKLIFSFMNNHYVGSSSVVKKEMEKILWHIHNHF